MDKENNFFGIPTFLSWLPDESLFSLISRHHFLRGHSISTRTCEQFFGHARSGSQHDLPSRLAYFVDRTGGCFGSVERVAKDHTLLAYYGAFVPKEELEYVIACLAGDSVAHLKLRLGILTSRFRANHPLKACESCMDEDRSAFGWAYWHVAHQYPGVWICQKHGHPLRESTLKATGVERFQWHLPSAARFRAWSAETQHGMQMEEGAIRNLSRLIHDLVTHPSMRNIDTARLHEVYRAELVLRSWVTVGGYLRMPEITSSYLEHTRHLRVLPELNALSSTTGEAVTQLGRMLRPPRSGTHPLRHLVLIDWLFGSSERFLQAYLAILNPQEIHVEGAVTLGEVSPDGGNDQRRDYLVKLVSAQGLSFRRVAKILGIDVATAMAWGAQAGIAVPRRPKKLSGELRRQVIDELKHGADKVDVARKAGVSVGTITKLLLSERGLHAAWTGFRRKRDQTVARRVWGKLVSTHKGLGIKYLRTIEPVAYGWLYRNDRAWLDLHKPARKDATRGSSASGVLWDVRDRALSAEVREAALNINRANGVRRIKLWQIYQAVPELKAKLAALERLPLTRRAIDAAMHPLSAGKVGIDLFG